MKKEIGGFRELDLRAGLEYYKDAYPARLNAGRCGIYHAARCLNVKHVLLPFYQCETVRDFLLKKSIAVSYYHIGEDMLPQLEKMPPDSAIVIVNYFGLIKPLQLSKMVRVYQKVIIDNTQAFYQPNVIGAYSVYSPRKFFGVADGCYVLGADVQRYLDEYPQDVSAPTADFLLSRIETGGNANYQRYLSNEERLSQSDICRMSKLSYALLDNVDYKRIRKKRQDNYDYAAKKFADINELPGYLLEREKSQVPMVYPLLVCCEDVRNILKANHIYVGQWWKYLLELPEPSDFEKRLSRCLLPIQIDQRYGKDDIDFTFRLITEVMK